MDDAAVPRPAPPWSGWTVGTRVVVRYRIERTRPGGPGQTDALGEVVALEATAVTVRTRSGDVRVPTAAITAGKRVPPPPPRRGRREPSGRADPAAP